MTGTTLAVRANSLSKSYRLGERKAAYGTLRDVLLGLTRRKRVNGDSRVLWALKDATFDIAQGEVVGLIGRNGAGKSTLLKLLSRITSPASGQVEIRGRVGSLLEVGTGFHQELTGRENIFLNGAILGMRRAEILKKLDEIVAFSEIEEFLDTPVKFYSSGMYVRLAFAVAAHLEPEILLVDEVLAVGDARFQRKCLNKMQTVGRHGLTVLFVSHTMAAVTRLCPRSLFLEHGRVVEDGPSPQVIRRYLHGDSGTQAVRSWADHDKAPGDDAVKLLGVRVLDETGEVAEIVDISEPCKVEIVYQVLKPGKIMSPMLYLRTAEGVDVFGATDASGSWRGVRRTPGIYRSVAWIPGNLLADGLFLASISIVSHTPYWVHFTERDAVAFNVVDSEHGETRGDYSGTFPGPVRPLLRWETSPET
jgi:lipopolysaccharide transport system ATP-binding protein